MLFNIIRLTLKILNAVSYDDNTEIKTGPGWLNELSSWIT
jgi:hypothetical protein